MLALLILAAFITLLFHISTGRPPLWVTVFFLTAIHLLGLTWPRF